MTTHVAGRAGRFGLVARYLPPVLIFISGILLWEATVRIFDIKGFILPKPSRIITVFSQEFSVVVSAGWFTMRKAMLGFAFGATAGVGVALVTARWPLIRDGAMPLAIAVNSTPIIALAPIMNNWFPITSMWPGAVVVALVVFFPVMINTVRGLTEVRPGFLELMDSYGAAPRDVLRKVRAPNSLPFVFAAFKVGTTLSVIAAVVSEYFGGSRQALGVYISQQAALFHFAEAWAAILVASFSGLVFYLAVVLAERAFIPWHASVRNLTT
ncbi:MAG: ABC transporter permease subunit [Acidimicrobiia bacterium]|nr:MAG: ABC transporter permease subunit [Acidimicrobiia bacterium]